jgi:hypothetical protein
MAWVDGLKTNGRELFFTFKNSPSQSYGPYNRAPINVKTCSLDLADFATTRLLIHWRVMAVCAMVGRPLAYRGRHSVICQWIRSLVVAKSAESGELVFTLMDVLLYSMYCRFQGIVSRDWGGLLMGSKIDI